MVSLYGLEGLGFRVWGLGFRDPINENHMEKRMDNKTETGVTLLCRCLL